MDNFEAKGQELFEQQLAKSPYAVYRVTARGCTRVAEYSDHTKAIAAAYDLFEEEISQSVAVAYRMEAVEVREKKPDGTEVVHYKKERPPDNPGQRIIR